MQSLYDNINYNQIINLNLGSIQIVNRVYISRYLNNNFFFANSEPAEIIYEKFNSSKENTVPILKMIIE